MKWVVLLFVLPVFAFGQSIVSAQETFDQSLHAFLSTDQASASVRTDAFLSHIDKLREKKQSSKSEEAFLRILFNKTHEKFLRHFDEYSSFGQLLRKGDYNCLSATALYALILQQCGINYDIVETNYHIFILVNTAGGQILLESTDPLNGFVTDSKEVEKRIKKYKENALQESNKNYYRLSCALYKHVQLEELTGLLHYNHAVKAFNEHNLASAIEHLDKATAIYCSPRMEELTRIVLLSVIESNNLFKEEQVRKIQVLRKRNLNRL